MQKSTALIIPRLPFARIVRDIMAEIDATLRIKGKALEALQEASEAMIATEFNSKFKQSRLITH
jgi:histone H3/H4